MASANKGSQDGRTYRMFEQARRRSSPYWRSSPFPVTQVHTGSFGAPKSNLFLCKQHDDCPSNLINILIGSVFFYLESHGLIESLDDSYNPTVVQLDRRDTDRPMNNIEEGHTDSVGVVALSPDGKRLASGSHSGKVRLWYGVSCAALMMLIVGSTSSKMPLL